MVCLVLTALFDGMMLKGLEALVSDLAMQSVNPFPASVDTWTFIKQWLTSCSLIIPTARVFPACVTVF